MKATIEIKELGENSYEATLTCGKQKEKARWDISPVELAPIEHKGIDKEYLALNRLGKQLLSKMARANMYPPGNPMKTPAQRKQDLEKKEE